jgi:mannan endo-1,4-beta-mannosidase
MLILFGSVSNAQIDAAATYETKALYQNLVEVGAHNLLFGHQDATAYGIGWTTQAGRSDVKEVCGDYPAVYGWDIGDIGNSTNLDGVSFANMKKWIVEAFERGGINTISMHLDNPFTKGTSWDNTPAVSYILPGGSLHNEYNNTLDQIAAFLKSLKTEAGTFVPIILRPYHEHTQTWSWWGRSACTGEDYIALWKMTIDYFKNIHGIHHLLYTISPQDVNSYDGYFFRYPGDDYIDVLGLDYYSLTNSLNVPALGRTLDMLGKEAQIRGKISAITETGVETVPLSTWWTECLYAAFNYSEDSRRTAWSLLWRNAHTNHFFAPYPGHHSVPDFLEFYNYSNTIFESDLPDMYSFNSTDSAPPVITSSTPDNLLVFDTVFKVRVETDERAYLKYSFTDEPYADMPYEFSSGQDGFVHSTDITAEHGIPRNIYINAVDVYDNYTVIPLTISVTVDTTKLAVSWNEFSYTDEDWMEGTAPIGFNDDGIVTIAEESHTIYFRKKVALPDNLNGLGLLIRGHDGFIAYINGIEIDRVNMPAIDDIIYQTDATGNSPVAPVFIFNDACMSALKDSNVVSVELHRFANDDNDVSFDARLFNNDGFYLDLGSKWKYFDKGAEPDDMIIDRPTKITESGSHVPHNFQLFQNYPNPCLAGRQAFNPSTKIQYSVGSLGGELTNRISLVVYDILGSEVVTLFDGRQNTGEYAVEFNTLNLPSGVYFYTLQASGFRETKKMILMR